MSTDLSINRTMWLTVRKLGFAALAGVSVVALASGFSPAVSQTLNDRLASQSGQKSRMLVDAREIVYDRDNDRVSAVGDVQVYYQGRVLEADRVTYDRKAKRVYAEGNAKLTEADGTKTFGTRFELSDDFRDGFIDSLRVETTERTRFSSARAERVGGEQTVLDRGTFTSCDACKENPERPPLWQVKAARIIHNNSQRRVYYENATLEFWGVPVAWLPFFSAPDPTVRNQSGVLAPRFINKDKLGYGLSVPLFWSIAPNYDLLFTPTYFTKQGLMADVHWRHRLAHGSYNIRANGIVQRDRKEFDLQPFAGAGQRSFRGSIETRGKFYLNEKWQFGWDGTWATDKHYFTDYKTKPLSVTNDFTSETTSQLYLRGRGERSWFDLTAYRFQGLTTTDWQKQIETAGPSFDFDRRFSPTAIGGELRVNLNAAAIKRDAAVFQPLAQATNPTYLPGSLLYSPSAGGLYAPCVYNVNGVRTGAYTPGQCLLRGFAGEYVRSSAEVTWRRKFIDPIGQEWTPFAGLRADVAWLRQSLSGLNAPDQGLQGFSGAGYGNANQAAFLGGNADNFIARAMPSVGLEYRYPFFAQTSLGTHYIEPMAQLVLRPNETQIGKLPNEDAQSLVFDENSLFALNKFSGYDRLEGGSRLNYGARYTFRSNGSAFGSLLVGQSVHLFGRNSFAAYDLANTGRNSGLETRRSDFIAAATVQPVQNFSFTARGRFDENSYALRRIDLEGRGSVGPLTVSGIYSRIAPQPELGNPLRREGLQLASYLSLPRNFYVGGSVLFDMDRYLSDKAIAASFPGATYRGTPWRVSSMGLAFGYKDECTDLHVAYNQSISDQLVNNGGGYTATNKRTQTVLVRLVLRELGEAQVTQRSESR
ncbi:Imp Organic solvent tolerance protein OstA [Rhabdaerophilaceae bacterium]